MPEMLILSLEPSTPLPERISAVFGGAIAWDFWGKSRSLANGCWTARQDWVSMRVGPHSLGKPIEWKRKAYTLLCADYFSPHSLGKPIEWKLAPFESQFQSLGVPTRWGNQLNGNGKSSEIIG